MIICLIFILLTICIIYGIHQTMRDKNEQFAQPMNPIETLMTTINRDNSESTIKMLKNTIATLQKRIDTHFFDMKNKDCGKRKYKRLDEPNAVRNEKNNHMFIPVVDVPFVYSKSSFKCVSQENSEKEIECFEKSVDCIDHLGTDITVFGHHETSNKTNGCVFKNCKKLSKSE